jgi:hypothetical protein
LLRIPISSPSRPESRGNRKAIPEWDGFENLREKSMPVRAMIEDEQQGKQ